MTQSLSQRAIRNSFSHFLGVAVNIATTLLVMPVVVGGIGVTQFGIWAIAGTLIGYSSILDLGLGQTLIKKTSEFLAKEDLRGLNESVGVILMLYVAISAVILGIFAMLVIFTPNIFNIPHDLVPTMRETLVILGFVATIGFPLSVFGGVIGGLQDFYVTNLLGAALNILKTAGTFVLLHFGYGLIALVLLSAALSCCGWAFSYVWVKRRLPSLALRIASPRGAAFGETLRFSLSMFIWSMAGQALIAADRLIVAVLLPIRFAGIYEVGARLNTYSRYAINVVFVLMPAASALFAQGKHAELRRVYIQGSKLVVGAYALVALGLFTLGTQFVELWLGSELRDGARVAQILAAASLFQSQNSLGHVILVGSGRLRVFTRVMVAYPIAILCFCSVMGLLFGMTGVAGGVLLSVVILESILLFHLLAVMEVSLGTMLAQVHMRILLCAIASGSVVWALGDTPFLSSWHGFAFKAVLLAIGYVALFWTLALSRQEREEMRGRLRRALVRSK